MDNREVTHKTGDIICDRWGKGMVVKVESYLDEDLQKQTTRYLCEDVPNENMPFYIHPGRRWFYQKDIKG